LRTMSTKGVNKIVSSSVFFLKKCILRVLLSEPGLSPACFPVHQL
jgi:hypothetical protein